MGAGMTMACGALAVKRGKRYRGRVKVSGEFEVHFTLASAETGALRAVEALAEELGMKRTHIVLASGQRASQPMLTQHVRGTLEEVLGGARETCARLAQDKAPVCRVKVEIAAEHLAAPANAREASARPGDWHFEHHVKVLLPTNADGAMPESLAWLEPLAARHGARWSRNARRLRADGQGERFLTQRFYGQGRDVAGPALQALVDELQQRGLTVLESEAEYVVHDSAVALDAGWMEGPR